MHCTSCDKFVWYYISTLSVFVLSKESLPASHSINFDFEKHYVPEYEI